MISSIDADASSIPGKGEKKEKIRTPASVWFLQRFFHHMISIITVRSRKRGQTEKKQVSDIVATTTEEELRSSGTTFHLEI
jgi:hypothetical protein